MNTCVYSGYWGLFTWIPAYLSLPPVARRSWPQPGENDDIFPSLLCAGNFWIYLIRVPGRRIRPPKALFRLSIIAAALVPIYGMTASPTLLLLLGRLVAFFGTDFSGYAAIASEIFPGEIRAAAMDSATTLAGNLRGGAVVVGALAVKHGIGPALPGAGRGLLCGGAAFLTVAGDARAAAHLSVSTAYATQSAPLTMPCRRAT